MPEKYTFHLTDEERNDLGEVIRRQSGTAMKVRRAHILLKADASGPGWTDQQIADAFNCRTRTVARLRKRVVEEGVAAALASKKEGVPAHNRLLDGSGEARLLAERLGDPPPGYSNWTLSLLADRVVQLELTDSISRESVRRTIKKNGMTQRRIAYWVIPPKANADFVAHMEDVLALYARPYDSRFPVVCMDEQPVQLIRDCHATLAASHHAPVRVDYEYERLGTASIFMFTEPLAGWRHATARPRKTKVDWAEEVATLLDGRLAAAERVILVSDNLNTHTISAFYEAYEPAVARAYIERLELRHTPKHGSWLNIAENELSAMTRQCLSRRRIPTVEMLNEEISAWALDANNRQKGVHWHMTVDDARVKLASLYPTLLL